MQEIPRLVIMTRIVSDCVRWLKTEWRFHFAVGLCAVVMSLFRALYASDPAFFARSGSVMTLTGGFMTFRSYLRGREHPHLRDTGAADRSPFCAWDPYTSKDKAKTEDVSALKWGIIFITLGTLIWGYGDLLLPSERRISVKFEEQHVAKIRPNQSSQRNASSEHVM